MARPFLSVLIDTYNHDKFIEEAVSSALAQDFPAADREVLVVDDGSTDRTPDILAKFASQIRILRKPNGGQASAFNYGIPQCRGEIIAFLDGDDWWAKDKLTKVVQAMNANLSVGIVGHGVINVLRDGTQRFETLLESFCFQANSLAGARLFRRRGAFLGTSRMTIRANLLRRIGPVPEEIQIQADEYLFTLASVLMTAQILPEALTFYRMHAGNRFQLDSYDEEKLRHKQKSLAALVKTLLHRLEELGTDTRLNREIVAYTQACADQLHLTLNGGWPWKTARTEWQLYRITHPDAELLHQAFKSVTLFGSLLVPPRTFYRVRNSLARSGRYQRVRERWLRVPEMKHIQNIWRKDP